MGSRGWDLTTGGGGAAGEIDLNGTPAQYLSTSRQRDQAVIDFLSANVANPFRGLIPGVGINGNITRAQLLRPYPHLLNVRTWNSDGTSRYNSAQFKLEKRFTRGYTLLVGYTWSKFTERVFQLNPSDTTYEERLSEADVPHRLAVSGIWELPFGRGRHWARDAGGLLDAAIGGWSLQAIGQIQSGRPISFHDRNIYFNGDLSALKTDFTGDSNNPVFDISGFYFNDAAVMTNGAARSGEAARRSAHPAGQQHPLLPVARARPAQPAAESLGHLAGETGAVRRPPARAVPRRVPECLQPVRCSATRTPIRLNANFGQVTSQGNLPRDIQLAAKILF